MGVLVLHSSADSIRALDHRADITKWDVMAGDLPPRLNERNIYSLTLPGDPFTSHCRGGLSAKWVVAADLGVQVAGQQLVDAPGVNHLADQAGAGCRGED